MARQLVTTAFAVLAAVSASAAPPVRTMYVDAIAKEQAVRTALVDRASSETVLKAVRHVVGQYETLVRRYPTSSYSDNALWQAGRLSLDAFKRFGQAPDQDAGIRLLRMLQAEYPTSKLAKLAAAQPSEKDAPKATATQGPAAQRVPVASTGTKPGNTGARPAVATIKGIRRVPMPDVLRVVIEIDKEVPFHEERIAGPARIFVDFGSTQATGSLGEQTLQFDGDNDIVRQVRIGRHPNATTRIVLDASGVSSYSVYPLYSPYRLVIDCVRATDGTSKPAVSSKVASTDVARPVLRREEPRPGQLTSHLLATQAGHRLPRVTPLASGDILDARLALTLASRGVGGTWQRRLPSVTPFAVRELADAYTPPILASRGLAQDLGRRLPLVAPAASATLAEATTPASAQRDGPSPVATTPTAAARSTSPPLARPGSGFSMARQLGLGVSRIVIDPGHGGHDPGAKSKETTEAELVLDVAQRLQRLLEEVPGIEVILTRQGDEFVPLQERTILANREGADLFLSIHANASANNQARGIETYFLNFASNLNAAQVAARENAASGQAMGALPDFVREIALHNKLDESRDFATLVQNAMAERLRPANKTLRNLGVKQAPFVVLIGASMPSVLAEISFLTNAQEAKLLKSDAYRQRIAEALFNGIRKYQTSLGSVERVAHE